MRHAWTLPFLFLLVGCAGRPYVDADIQDRFTYEMWLPGHSKDENWRGARDYLASTYRDEQMTLDIADADGGGLVGKGTLAWHLPNGQQCLVRYQLQFTATEDRARLQFTASLNDISGGGDCDDWRRISTAGYKEMKSSFERVAAGLQVALGRPIQAANVHGPRWTASLIRTRDLKPARHLESLRCVPTVALRGLGPVTIDQGG